MEYLSAIKHCSLFKGIAEEELKDMLNCLSVRYAEHKRNKYLIRFGDAVTRVGIVISGRVHAIKEDYWGNRNIIAQMGPGDVFAESFACIPGATAEIDVVTTEQTKVAMLGIEKLLTTCSSACVFHRHLIRNLLSLLAEKNLKMNEKFTHITKRTTRDKLLSYLSAEAIKAGSASFAISFNRQELADYLSVDRSALSNELSKMRNEGILLFDRNLFTLSAL